MRAQHSKHYKETFFVYFIQTSNIFCLVSNNVFVFFFSADGYHPYYQIWTREGLFFCIEVIFLFFFLSKNCFFKARNEYFLGGGMHRVQKCVCQLSRVRFLAHTHKLNS